MSLNELRINSCDKLNKTTQQVNNFANQNLKISRQNNPSGYQLKDIYILNSINKNEDINNNYKKNTKNVNSTARRRWKILARAILKSESSTEDDEQNIDDGLTATQRLETFSLIKHQNLILSCDLKNNYFGNEGNWYEYRIKIENIHKEYTINVHHVNYHPSAVDLMGFNNTGNICVWPSEEALTYYILEHLELFHDKWVLELGGGMSCLAGLFVAKYGNPFCVHLTDGNRTSVENVEKTIRLNKFNCFMRSSLLKWEYLPKGDIAQDYMKYDYILSADCIFFEESRLSLIHAIWYYLSMNGVALVMAPRRAGTLEIFAKLATEKGFYSKIVDRYNEEIWRMHIEMGKSNLYDENLHYPILIMLSKSNSCTN